VSRLRDVAEGLTLLILGLLKKLVIADSVAVGATAVFDAAKAGHLPTLLEAWFAAFAYALQIYFDFSAYSDMAIGVARMFGIDLPINFASPYKARSIAEFWRRWHITLSRFLRDYLYIPLGGNRHGPWRQRLNLMLTMALGGLWHGAEWTFLIWGCLHGLYLTINHLWRSWSWGRGLASSRVGGALSLVLTLLCVVLAWVPFRSANLETAGRIWAGMFGAHGVVLPEGLASTAWGLPVEPLLGFNTSSLLWLGVFLVMALKAPNVYQLLAPARLGLPSRGYPDAALPKLAPLFTWRPSLGVGVLMGVAMAVILLELNDVSEFIYFQF
jgi:D-alanyl-lipoteichoic acid acyltransferase DltB (MBOAT superfamily)